MGMASLISVQYHYGWGRHYIYIDPSDRMQALKFNSIGQSFGWWPYYMDGAYADFVVQASWDRPGDGCRSFS